MILRYLSHVEKSPLDVHADKVTGLISDVYEYRSLV